MRAAADGTARVRKWATQTRPGGRDGDEPYNGGYGNCVVIEHAGGWATLYGHLSRVEGVGSDGTPVSRGQVIGWMGNTGWSTAPHIHIHLGKATSPLRSKETTFEGAINPTKGQKCRSNNSAGGGAPSVAMGDMRPGENYGSAEQRATASTKIRNAHRTEAGSPRNNGGSEYVHRWGACWIQDFDGAGGGAIILPDNASDKAVWIHGVIWRKYCDLGGPSSPLGYPTSDEFLAAIYSGRQPDWASAGKGTRFRHSNPDYDGDIYYHENGAHGGRAFAVWGPLRGKYEPSGTGGELGFPISDVREVGSLIYCDFEGGVIMSIDGGKSFQVLPGFSVGEGTTLRVLKGFVEVYGRNTDVGRAVSKVSRWAKSLKQRYRGYRQPGRAAATRAVSDGEWDDESGIVVIDDEETVRSLTRQGVIRQDPGAAPGFAVKGACWTKYQASGADKGVLGVPIQDTVSFDKGLRTDFQNNASVYAASVGTYANRAFGLWSSIGKRYRDGRGSGDEWVELGLPITDQHTVWPSLKGTTGEECLFERGGIFSSRYGAFALSGKLHEKYLALDATMSALGFPTGELPGIRTAQQTGTPYRVITFEAGAIFQYEDGSGKLFAVFGGVGDRYRALGYGDSPLGLPTADVAEDQLSKYGIRADVGQFQNGAVVFYKEGTAEVNGKAFVGYGPVYAKYAEHGGAATLGLPLGDATTVTSGPTGVHARRLKLEYGLVYQILDGLDPSGQPFNPATDVYVVGPHPQIRPEAVTGEADPDPAVGALKIHDRFWSDLGGEGGKLGLPVSPEFLWRNPPNGQPGSRLWRTQEFERGNLKWDRNDPQNPNVIDTLYPLSGGQAAARPGHRAALSAAGHPVKRFRHCDSAGSGGHRLA